MALQQVKIAIVGGGIGGLATAVALHQRGLTPHVYEQAQALGEVGAGLTISASATLALNALNLGDQLADLEPYTPHFGALDPQSGARRSYEARDLKAYVARFGESTRHVHRADLHQLLANALPDGCVSTHHRVERIETTESGSRLVFADQSPVEANLVVACDGLKSVIREQQFSPAPATFTGFVAWRGLVDRQALPDLCLDPHFATFASKDRLFARYPLRRGSLINYVAIARKPDFTAESWHSHAEIDEVLAEFAGWHSDVTRLISATPEGCCMKWALYTRQPLQRWVTDRVCLLGDAAHPMTPFYGMGAAMAIEDGLVLARCLADSVEVDQALARFEKARLERGNQMQRVSLERAETYMGKNPSQRHKPPAAGLQNQMDYNPATVPV